MDTAEFTWTPPAYDISGAPAQSARFSLLPDEEFTENFPRQAKWCADGSTALVQCENRSFQVIRINTPTRVFKQPAPILDFVWYPTATPQDPSSFCFLASVRDCPVKLLDANDGRLRASYRIIDHRERFIAPHALAFNHGAQKIYCAFEDAIEVFDTNRPGEGFRLHTSPSKKSKDGLKGIISALAFSPDYTTDVFAAGSLTPHTDNLALFSESSGESPVMFVGGGPGAGVGQILFNPARPWLMYASFRRKEGVYVWDVRSNVDEPLRVYSTPANLAPSNQRRRFDVDYAGRWLGIGEQDGCISMFDLDKEHAEVGPELKWSAHGDSIGSVCFHPLQAAVLSASGARHFDDAHEDDHEDEEIGDEDEDEDEERGDGTKNGITKRERNAPQPREACLKRWDFGGPSGL